MTRHLLDTVTVPVITAFTAGGDPDPGGTTTLLDHLAGHGIDTIMVFGSNGEGVAVDTQDVGGYTRQIAARWRRVAGPTAAVLVAVTGPSTVLTVRRAEAALSGADALVVSPPYYFRHSEDELFDHFRRIDELGLAWVAYNIPRYTGNPISPALAGRLAGLDGWVGIKDSGGDLDLLAAFAAHTMAVPRFRVSQGTESALVAGLRTGATGITPGLANLAPGACRALFDAVARGDLAEADGIQSGLNRLASIHAIRPGIAATKAALG
ncbi:MAG TPA: dihydrodipicolinate synthase family protein, partial [Rugosimonospora sp.]